jgi:Tfp pilus assembly protein PilN
MSTLQQWRESRRVRQVEFALYVAAAALLGWCCAVMVGWLCADLFLRFA